MWLCYWTRVVCCDSDAEFRFPFLLVPNTSALVFLSISVHRMSIQNLNSFGPCRASPLSIPKHLTHSVPRSLCRGRRSSRRQPRRRFAGRLHPHPYPAAQWEEDFDYASRLAQGLVLFSVHPGLLLAFTPPDYDPKKLLKAFKKVYSLLCRFINSYMY